MPKKSKEISNKKEASKPQPDALIKIAPGIPVNAESEADDKIEDAEEIVEENEVNENIDIDDIEAGEGVDIEDIEAEIDETNKKTRDDGEPEGEENEENEENAELYGDDTYEKKEPDETCLYNFAEQKDEDEEYEDYEIENDNEEIKEIIVKKEDRITKAILTKYERVRILGDRAKGLASGAKPMLLNVENLDPKTVAKMELQKGVIPFIIERKLPDGSIEHWKVNELKIVN